MDFKFCCVVIIFATSLAFLLYSFTFTSLFSQNSSTELFDKLPRGDKNFWDRLIEKSNSNITSSGGIIDRYHQVMLYNKVPGRNICVVESLVNALLREDQKYCTKSNVMNTAEIYIYLMDKNQFLEDHGNIMSKLEKSTLNNPCRVIRLLYVEANFNSLVVDTPLENFYKKASKGSLGRYNLQNRANALRLATIYHLGGVYTDLDFIIFQDPAKNLIENGLSMELPTYLNNAVLYFRNPKNPYILKLMQDFVENYDGNHWGQQGPLLVTRVTRDYCNCGPSYNIRKDHTCICPSTNVTVWNRNAVYPLDYSKSSMNLMFLTETQAQLALYSKKKSIYWKSSEEDSTTPIITKNNTKSKFKSLGASLENNDKFQYNPAVMMHLWHNVIKSMIVHAYCEDAELFNMSLYSSIKKRYCPISYDRYDSKVDDKKCKKKKNRKLKEMRTNKDHF